MEESMLAKLRAYWQTFVQFVLRRHEAAPRQTPAQAQPAEPAPIASEPAPAAGRAPPPLEAGAPSDARDPPPAQTLNRHDRRRIDAERRKLERARMRHDEWVTPGGPEPVKHEHAAAAGEPKAAATPIPPDDFLDPNDRPIADEWVEGDGGGDVLFEESEFYGTYNFRDTILKQLERYWVYIERMKRNDPDSYGFYKQLGATLLPYIATGANRKHELFKKYRGKDLEEYKKHIQLSPWFKQHWPAFGCICYGINPLDEAREKTELNGNLWTPKFIYFTRIEPNPWPWYVQPMRGGKIYLMTMWWDRPDHPKGHRKWGVPNDFPIWVSDDGNTIRALKTREASNGDIRPDYDWRIPYAYSEWAKQYGLTAQIHLSHCFANAANEVERTYYSTCRVAVSKGDLTAVFGIEPQRVPYFFRDRDYTLDEHGRRKRVFHAVRPHVRGDGTAMPMQFRGEKEFDWAGYHVSITVPGRDHFLLQEFDVPCMILRRRDLRNKDHIKEADIATWLKKKIKAGFGAYR
jgi:hypothetical protein